MNPIELKFENKLPKKYITIPLQDMGEYTQDSTGNSDISPSNYIGITEPLISINNSVVTSGSLRSFSLSIKNHIPKITFTFEDWYKRFSIMDRPKVDNIILLQILPKFEDHYKKINLRFYIDKFKLDDRNNEITISAVYCIDELYNTELKSFGKISSYQYFMDTAKKLKLGFATNITSQIDDKHWIYKSYINDYDCMNREISMAGNEDHIIDYWIDYWNNLNYVNVKELWKEKASDEDLKIWVGEFLTDAHANHETKVRNSKAILHNNPNFPNDPLYMSVCLFKNNLKNQIAEGNDKSLYVYNYNDNKYNNIVLQDGDVKTNIFKKQIYVGEDMLDSGYLAQKYYRKALLNKISNNTTIVELSETQFGLMQGDKCEIMYFEQDEINQSIMLDGQDEMKNETKNDVNNTVVPDTLMLNKDISNQYYITNCSLKWDDNLWTQEITLSAPNTNSSYTKILLEKNDK